MVIAWSALFGESDECRGIRNSWISIAPKKDTREIWIRHSPDGLDWSSDPVLAIPDYGSTSQKYFHVHYDGEFIWIVNGVDRIYRSPKYGAAGSWVAH